MLYVYKDGGREAAGYKGAAGDCVTRAIAIATGKPYAEVYGALQSLQGKQRQSKHTRKRGTNSVRAGVWTSRKWFKDFMRGMGWVWVPTMQIGSGCKVHLRADELPAGRLIVSVSKHYVAVIDGVVHDTHDCTRSGERCVYGYWREFVA